MFSRQSPSPRYTELLDLYRKMHTEGDIAHKIPAANTFDGRSLLPHVDEIEKLIRKYNAQTILDYGCGKGVKYKDGTIQQKWKTSVTMYDPAYSPLSNLPGSNCKFDGVVCTDVMEHCPEEDIDWILDEIFNFATNFVYLNIACFPAQKTLPNGENAHCTVKEESWWWEKFTKLREKFPQVEQRIIYDRNDAPIQKPTFTARLISRCLNIFSR